MTNALKQGFLWHLVALVVLSFYCIAYAQELTKLPTFEVSTVRKSNPDTQESNLDLGAAGIRSSNLPVMFLLKFAFNLNDGSNDQVIGAPSWILSLPFDIRAKVDAAAAARIGEMSTDDRIAITRKMVQTLLEDRFQLKVHHESRELSVLALTIAKGGSKLTVVSNTRASSTTGAGSWTGFHNPGAGETEGRDVPVALLVSALSSKPEIGGRLVLDQTQLIGKYSFKLTWMPEEQHAPVDGSGPNGPSLFTAIQEQLGLKLEPRKVPVDCVVIDHIEQPDPN